MAADEFLTTLREWRDNYVSVNLAWREAPTTLRLRGLLVCDDAPEHPLDTWAVELEGGKTLLGTVTLGLRGYRELRVTRRTEPGMDVPPMLVARGETMTMTLEPALAEADA